MRVIVPREAVRSAPASSFGSTVARRARRRRARRAPVTSSCPSRSAGRPDGHSRQPEAALDVTRTVRVEQRITWLRASVGRSAGSTAAASATCAPRRTFRRPCDRRLGPHSSTPARGTTRCSVVDAMLVKRRDEARHSPARGQVVGDPDPGSRRPERSRSWRPERRLTAREHVRHQRRGITRERTTESRATEGRRRCRPPRRHPSALRIRHGGRSSASTRHAPGSRVAHGHRGSC
jgi:hypothetical protein